MGTRHLTIVKFGGEYKIAQYGQWDGYPEGQGVTALEFIRKIVDSNLTNEFAYKVKNCRWITEEEVAAIEEDRNWPHKHPELSRDAGAGILQMVMDSKNGLVLVNRIDFAADSLFCEWAWLIDLDAWTFEAYKGFNQTRPLTEKDRFYFLVDKEECGYHCIVKVAEWSIDNLPSNEDFLNTFKEDEE
jgi:hypothetical protein